MYAIVDIETTGGFSQFEKITEIAIFIHDGEKVTGEFSTLINPEKNIPQFITRLTGIDNGMVASAPKFYEVAKEIVEITNGKIIVAHNAQFDYSFIRQEFKSLGYNFNRNHLCTVRLSRKLIPGFRSYSLGNLCNSLGIKIEGRHRAGGDALATVKLFEILLRSDKGGVIQQSVKGDMSLLKIPPGLSKEALDKLPEEAGVYYFHNEAADIIYIGKSNNIRKRVFSHFAEKSRHKTLSMKNEVCDITFEKTGSELIALLLESDEIKKHKPRYNRAQREAHLHYGIFKSVNEEGYMTLHAAKITGSEEPVLVTQNLDTANEILSEQSEKHRLCAKLCGLHHIDYACFRYHINQCNGACIGKEPPEEYNKRVVQLIRKWRFKHSNFILVGQGRNAGENSIVAVENGKYVGFGYIQHDFEVTNHEQLKSFIRSYADNSDVQRILRHHLDSRHTDKVISY